LALVAACGAGAASPAADVARAWAHAVQGDDPRAAYELLAPDVQRKRSFAAFARDWRESRAERARQGAALGEAAQSQVGERARLALPGGTSLRLTHEAGGWRLEAPLLPAERAATAEEALRQLATAVEQRSFPGVFRLLSTEKQEGLRQLLDSFAAGLRAHAKESIEVANDRATLLWTDGTRRWRVVLKREQGGWRIEDFTPQ
jgi:hypothetical protein